MFIWALLSLLLLFLHEIENVIDCVVNHKNLNWIGFQVSRNASSGIFSISFKNYYECVVVSESGINRNIEIFRIEVWLTWFSSEKAIREYWFCVQTVLFEKDEYIFVIGETGWDISNDRGKTKRTGYYGRSSVLGYQQWKHGQGNQ